MRPGWLLATGLALASLGAPRCEDARPATPATDTAGRDASLIVFPIAFYTPETETAVALAGGMYKRFPGRDRPSSLEGQILYTQRSQYGLSLKAGHYLENLAGYFSLGLSVGEFPDVFYGVGGTVPASAKERFTARTYAVEGEADKAIAPGVRAGGIAGWARQSMVETEPGGLLDRSAVTGSGSWSIVRLGPRLSLDTRNSAYYPTWGLFATATVTQCPRFAGSDYEFGQVEINARKYLPLGKKGVLALQAVADGMWGDIPFPFLSKLGGSELLRGYYQGRFRDRDMACLQSEYRFGIWRRLTGAGFAAAGKLADDPADLPGAHLRYAYGGGLRIRLNAEGVNLRGDFAINREGETATYITFMEAY
ncbi:MAG: hypothetical protein JWP91_4138 [Fibrobacteres bacterium]|nr:hypothetical protein [Fibrobacterota bacterium]